MINSETGLSGGDTARQDGSERSAASRQELENARSQMPPPSQDWTELSNILRRSGGGSSRSRAHGPKFR